jgi:peptidase M1-like protein
MNAERIGLARRWLGIPLVLAMGLVVPGAARGDGPPPPKADASRLEAIFDGFYSVELDTEHPLEVQDFVLSKDAMDFTFKKGRFYLAKPLEGEVTGAYFVGEGTMKLVPPNKTEKKALNRGYGKDLFEEPITEVVMRFDDGTEKQLAAAGKPGTPAVQPPGTWAARNKIEYNSDDLQMDFLEKKIGGVTGRDFFAAEVNTAGGKWIDFVDRGRYRLEVSLFVMHAFGAAGKRGFENWCTFHKKDDYDAKGNYTLLPEADDKNPAALRDVKMTVEIPNTKTVRIDATEEVESLVDHLGLIRFDLVNNIDASSWSEKGRPVNVELVADGSGTPLPYIHKWHQLLVVPPHPLARGEKTSIHVRATEDTIIELTTQSYWIYTSYAWFPKIGYSGGRFTFDWVVKMAKPLKIAGSGDLVKEWEEGKMACGEWRSTVPVHIPSFIFGDFVTTDGVYKREAPGAGEIPLRLFSIRGGDRGPQLKEENIIYNVQQGLKAYENLFGPYPYHDLDMTQMARGLGFSQSPPGILLLSSVLGVTGGGGTGDQVLFHELAHQWWGHQVGWAGAQDTWISESWAEYSSGLITQGISQAKFDEMREQWKKDALVGDPSGTIETATWSEYRNALLYAKGPYVVHMLRTWMGWEKFSKLVSTIQSKYKNQDINTDTIARETSALMGYDMFPFFDQWIRDQGIPKVHYSWTSEPDADGKVLITIRTRQEDKENFKILMVPISFDFGKEKPVVLMKPILSAETEIKVKVPVKPRDVRLDDEASQLADFIKDNS